MTTVRAEELLAELEDMEYEGAAFMPIRAYATHREVRPQLVYYWLRRGYIEDERCACGRRIIDVERADKALSSRGYAK